MCLRMLLRHQIFALNAALIFSNADVDTGMINLIPVGYWIEPNAELILGVLGARTSDARGKLLIFKDNFPRNCGLILLKCHNLRLWVFLLRAAIIYLAFTRTCVPCAPDSRPAGDVILSFCEKLN